MDKSEFDFKDTGEELLKRLADLKPRQEAGEHMPCPRCGRYVMDEKPIRNALSRCADVFICDACGSDEALRAMCQAPLPLRDWAYLISERGAGGTSDEL